MALTRRGVALGLLALPSAARAEAPSWPECARRPRCRWVEMSRWYDGPCLDPPPGRTDYCFQAAIVRWRCEVCGKLEATVE